MYTVMYVYYSLNSIYCTIYYRWCIQCYTCDVYVHWYTVCTIFFIYTSCIQVHPSRSSMRSSASSSILSPLSTSRRARLGMGKGTSYPLQVCLICVDHIVYMSLVCVRIYVLCVVCLLQCVCKYYWLHVYILKEYNVYVCIYCIIQL